MIFYVLGNGFDIHYNLPTKYCNFKNYLIRNGYDEIVQKVDNLFWERGDFNPQEIENWSTFENMLVVFNRLSSDDLYQEAFANAETDDDRAGFWDSPSWNADYFNEYVEILKQQFFNWINGINTVIMPDEYFNPVPGDAVLTFNYTTTVEDNYNTMGIQVTHIHGTKNQEIVVGHNEKPSPELFRVIEDEDSDYRDVTTKNTINRILTQASQNYYKNSIQILHRYHTLFTQIPHFDKVVIMGLSCGQQDKIYIQEIIKYASVIDFYYHDNETKNNFECILGSSNITVNYYKW